MKLARKHYCTPNAWVYIVRETNLKFHQDTRFQYIHKADYIIPGKKIWLPKLDFPQNRCDNNNDEDQPQTPTLTPSPPPPPPPPPIDEPTIDEIFTDRGLDYEPRMLIKYVFSILKGVKKVFKTPFVGNILKLPSVEKLIESFDINEFIESPNTNQAILNFLIGSPKTGEYINIAKGCLYFRLGIQPLSSRVVFSLLGESMPSWKKVIIGGVTGMLVGNFAKSKCNLYVTNIFQIIDILKGEHHVQEYLEIIHLQHSFLGQPIKYTDTKPIGTLNNVHIQHFEHGSVVVYPDFTRSCVISCNQDRCFDAQCYPK